LAKPRVRPSIRARSSSSYSARKTRSSSGRVGDVQAADGGDLGVDEGGPGQGRVVDPLGQTEHGVLEDDGRLALGGVGELVAPQDVADGVDVPGPRLQEVVHLDAAAGVGADADGLEVQPLDVGQPPGGDQDVRAFRLVGGAVGRAPERDGTSGRPGPRRP
jgi:hypothetical protein